jgi:AraC-like DNA-binding protein
MDIRHVSERERAHLEPSAFRLVRVSESEQLRSLSAPLEIDVLPAAPGRFSAAVGGFSLGAAKLTVIRADGPIMARGAFPSSAFGVLVPLRLQAETRWLGGSVERGSLAWYGPREEHLGHSRGAQLTAVVVFPTTSPFGVPSSAETWMSAGAAVLGQHAVGAVDLLRALIGRAALAAQSSPRALDSPEACRSLALALHRVISRMHEGMSEPRKALRRSPTTTVRLAREYLEQRLEEPVYLAEICAVAGVSERSLRNAFATVLGVSPNQYLLLRRLNGVRRSLLAPADAVSVTQTALRFGFWDLGRFAASYRAQFAENPSRTLRRSRRA